MFFHNLALAGLLAVSAPLPTPTPGLNEQGQQINYAALTQGKLIKEAVIYGRAYAVRGIQNILVLYNDKGHVIGIFQCNGDEILYVLASTPEDPFPNAETVKKTTVDGITYTLKIEKRTGLVIAVYEEHGKVIFAMADPSAALVPETVEETPFDPFSN